jgi:hypothetical protein
MGQAGIITGVTAGRTDDLERYLSALPRDIPPAKGAPAAVPRSPFTGALPPTHFARFAVIELDSDPYLFFSSRFDGPPRDYLRALAGTEHALAIWSHCQVPRAGDALTAAELDAYLCDKRNWRISQYVVSAIPPELTVGQINRALSLRAQLSGLVTRAAALDPTALAHDFRQLPAIRAVLGRR